MRVFQIKSCITCKQEYVPTAGHQKRCTCCAADTKLEASRTWLTKFFKDNPELAVVRNDIRRYEFEIMDETEATLRLFAKTVLPYTAEWRELKAKYDNKCLCCGRSESEVELTVDHIVPLSLGGSNHPANLQVLCRACNSSKHTDIIDYRPANLLAAA